MTIDPTMARLHSRLKMRHMVLLKLLGTVPNIRRAAIEMSISQPSASALLREIEDALEVDLFVRETQGLRATLAGETMIGWAEIILADLDQAKSDLEALARGAGSRVRVGVSPLAAPELLPRALALFREQSPDVTIAVQTGIEETLIPSLLAGELDCIVARMAAKLHHGALDYHILYNESASVVVRAGHPLARSATIVPAELDRYQWILPIGAGVPYDITCAALLAFGAGLPQVAVETWSTIVIVHLLRSSDLIAVVPSSVARQHAADLATLPLPLAEMLYPVSLLSRPRPAADHVFAGFIDAVKRAGIDCDPARR